MTRHLVCLISVLVSIINKHGRQFWYTVETITKFIINKEYNKKDLKILVK